VIRLLMLSLTGQWLQAWRELQGEPVRVEDGE